MTNFIWLFSALTGFIIWISQKQIERKMKIFEDAVTALLRYHNEAGNHELQNEHYELTNKVRRRGPYLTDETSILMLRSRALVFEFFSHTAASRFAEALDSVHFEGPNSLTGGPTIVGYRSIPELESIIQDLSKELTFSSIFKMPKLCLFIRKLIRMCKEGRLKTDDN